MRVNSFDPSLSHEHHTTKFYAEGTSYGPASGVHLVLPDMSADKARAVLAFLKTLEVA